MLMILGEIRFDKGSPLTPIAINLRSPEGVLPGRFALPVFGASAPPSFGLRRQLQ